MKKREKMLLAGLIGILVLWQGGVMLNKFIFAPVAERQADIAARETRVFAKRRELRLSEDAARKLKDWKKRSLPPDPVVATSLYQNWLIDVTAKAKLTNPTVTPNKSTQPKGDTFNVVSATIKAQGTLARLCDFLYEFRQSGLLHRVSRMTLATDEHKGDPKLDIELTVEGLSLKEAQARSTLFSDDNVADLPSEKPLRDRKTYTELLAKNLFVRGYNGPPGPVGPKTKGPTPPPPDDPREFVYLVGSFSTGGSFDAMLYDRSTNETRQLVEGSDFSVAGVEGRVVSIGVDFITFKMKGDEWRLELGENLAQMRKLTAPAKVETGASDSPADPDAG